LTVYKFNGALQTLWKIQLEGAPRSIDLYDGTILLGLKTGSIVEMPFSNNGKAKLNRVMTSHCDGEVWGLDVIEIGKGQSRVITSADDNRLLAYDVKSKFALAEGQVHDSTNAKKTKAKRGGASTMASTPPQCQSRAVAWSSRLGHLAVANNKG